MFIFVICWFCIFFVVWVSVFGGVLIGNDIFKDVVKVIIRISVILLFKGLSGVMDVLSVVMIGISKLVVVVCDIKFVISK